MFDLFRNKQVFETYENSLTQGILLTCTNTLIPERLVFAKKKKKGKSPRSESGSNADQEETSEEKETRAEGAAEESEVSSEISERQSEVSKKANQILDTLETSASILPNVALQEKILKIKAKLNELNEKDKEEGLSEKEVENLDKEFKEQMSVLRVMLNELNGRLNTKAEQERALRNYSRRDQR